MRFELGRGGSAWLGMNVCEFLVGTLAFPILDTKFRNRFRFWYYASRRKSLLNDLDDVFHVRSPIDLDGPDTVPT